MESTIVGLGLRREILNDGWVRGLPEGDADSCKCVKYSSFRVVYVGMN